MVLYALELGLTQLLPEAVYLRLGANSVLLLLFVLVVGYYELPREQLARLKRRFS